MEFPIWIPLRSLSRSASSRPGGQPRFPKISRFKHIEGMRLEDPPPTNSGILEIYKDPNIITITSWGHY